MLGSKAERRPTAGQEGLKAKAAQRQKILGGYGRPISGGPPEISALHSPVARGSGAVKEPRRCGLAQRRREAEFTGLDDVWDIFRRVP